MMMRILTLFTLLCVSSAWLDVAGLKRSASFKNRGMLLKRNSMIETSPIVLSELVAASEVKLCLDMLAFKLKRDFRFTNPSF